MNNKKIFFNRIMFSVMITLHYITTFIVSGKGPLQRTWLSKLCVYHQSFFFTIWMIWNKTQLSNSLKPVLRLSVCLSVRSSARIIFLVTYIVIGIVVELDVRNNYISVLISNIKLVFTSSMSRSKNVQGMPGWYSCTYPL